MFWVFYDGELHPVMHYDEPATEEQLMELIDLFPLAIYFQDGEI